MPGDGGTDSLLPPLLLLLLLLLQDNHTGSTAQGVMDDVSQMVT